MNWYSILTQRRDIFKNIKSLVRISDNVVGTTSLTLSRVRFVNAIFFFFLSTNSDFGTTRLVFRAYDDGNFRDKRSLFTYNNDTI